MTQIPKGQNDLDERIVQAKKQLETLMLQFNTFLQDKILPENKSQGQLKTESEVIMRLLVAANDLDGANPPEGTYALITLLIRESLYYRDVINKVRYNVETLKQEVNKLKAQIADLSRAQRL